MLSLLRFKIQCRPDFHPHIMLCRIIFCSAVSLAMLSVIVLAFFSPSQRKNLSKDLNRPWVALSLYIQQPQNPSSNSPSPASGSDAGAFIFHHTLTEGPENTSKAIGKAQGFIIPIENFANSPFNVIYLTFDTPHYSGSLGVEAKHITHKDKQELTVVGGTGSFAFARGLAELSTDVGSTYHVKLQLNFPDRSHSIPG